MAKEPASRIPQLTKNEERLIGTYPSTFAEWQRTSCNMNVASAVARMGRLAPFLFTPTTNGRNTRGNCVCGV